MAGSIGHALLSLNGLSVGDAFGEQFFSLPVRFITERQLPAALWRWTDDTHMALSIVEVLAKHHSIEQDALAKAFVGRFLQEPYRGYAGGAAHLLKRISHGEDWRTVSPSLFNGGSYGNGGAMRVAPIGGFFAGDPEQAAEEAKKSAVITHAHPEGQAGAIAVAVAAAITAVSPYPTGAKFLQQVLQFVPQSQTYDGILQAIDIPASEWQRAVLGLGTGTNVSAQDTVPFCLWSAAHRLDNFEEALWQTARGMGDVDTTCAIVGGIVALSSGHIPHTWIEQREPLPAEFTKMEFMR